jgi:hypothetical protein
MSSSDESPGVSPQPPELPEESPALVIARHSYLNSRQAQPSAPAPRFGTAHLMLWVSCTAVFLSIVRALANQPVGVVGMGIACTSAATTGAAWAGLLIFVSRRIRRVAWPIEPGEWLVAVLGASLAIQMLQYLLPSNFHLRTEFVAGAAMCCLLVVPTLSRQLPASWKALFIFLIGLYSLPMLLIGCGLIAVDRFAQAVQQLPLPLSIVAICIVAVWKWRTGPRYGWLHWAGIAVWICVAALKFMFVLWL